MNNNELYHYGILGMKWGRRKGTTTSSKQKSSNKKLDGKQNASSVKNTKSFDIGKKTVKGIFNTTATLGGVIERMETTVAIGALAVTGVLAYSWKKDLKKWGG